MKNVICAFLTIFSLSCISNNANAQRYFSLIMTHDTCGNWVEKRSKGDADFNMEALRSFLSGMVLGSKKDFLRNVDEGAIFVWTDNYCNANPTDGLIKAAMRFSEDMIKKEGL